MHLSYKDNRNLWLFLHVHMGATVAATLLQIFMTPATFSDVANKMQAELPQLPHSFHRSFTPYGELLMIKAGDSSRNSTARSFLPGLPHTYGRYSII